MENKKIIKCGKNSDSLETLETLCRKEADKLLSSIEIKDEKVSVPCWTDGLGFAELICVVVFQKNENGKTVYELDFTESTL